MIEQIGNALIFYAHYIETKVGKTGLTVTVDVYRNSSIIVTAASATEVAGGLYKYELASGSNNAEGEYIAIFKTATSTVDQQWIPALWVTNKAGVENLDGAVSTRATPAQVNTEVLDVLNVDTFGEPTGAPAATTTLAGKIGRVYQALRNAITVTSSSKAFKDDSGSALWSKSVSDDGTTYTENEGS